MREGAQKKKLVGFVVMLLVIALLSPNIDVYATNSNEGLGENTYDSMLDKGVWIVIRGAEGNIVETHELGRQLVVNGNQYTIPAYGTMTIGTYYAANNFMAGFYFVHSLYTGYATTRNREVEVRVRHSSTLHGVYDKLIEESFYTNEESNYSSPYYYSGIQPGCSCVAYSITPSNNKHYFEVRYKNKSSLSVVLSALIARD